MKVRSDFPFLFYLVLICVAVLGGSTPAFAGESQVQIDAKILEAHSNCTKELGTELFQTGARDFTQPGVVQSGGPDSIQNEFGFGTFGSMALEATLRALERGERPEILSQPRILTLDNARAELRALGGVQLLVTPQVISDGQIQLDLTPEISGTPSSPKLENGESTSVPGTFNQDQTLQLDITPVVTPEGGVLMQLDIASKKIVTQVLVDNGQTVVLGGIVEEEVTRAPSKVPILGDIPLLGRLFRNKGGTDTRSNLVIFVTPHIVKPA